MGRLKGICYGNDVFPSPYNPSTANQTLVFFGSDAAANYIAPLWSGSYQSVTGSSCQSSVPNPPPTCPCRNDLARMAAMGVDLVRLYDWDPRNNHQPFLDNCQKLGIDVLVSVSNYFLQPGGGLPNMNQQIPALIQSYSKGADYHPAVAGIVMGNEFDLPGNGISVPNCVAFTQAWLTIEQQQFSGYRKVLIGHPVSFAVQNNRPPCWYIWDQLLPQITALGSRLFLAPQTYNHADYLFQNDGSGGGWVDRTYNQYQFPILFTEIGQDRTKPNYVNVVMDQLQGCLSYIKQNPSKMIGVCMFSYADKVWMQGSSEGSFGAWTHTNQVECTITYGPGDFTHWDVPTLGTLGVDVLSKTELWGAVQQSYANA
jgi:hypothetical protein